MNNLEQLKQELAKTKNKCAEIEKKIEELESKVRWRAKENEIYYYFNDFGEIHVNRDGCCGTDTDRYDLGNYFETEEEAKKAVEKIKIYTQLKDLAMRLNKGEKINWDNILQRKYHISLNHSSNVLMCLFANWSQDIGQIYCLDENFLDVALQEIGEENLRKLFE